MKFLRTIKTPSSIKLLKAAYTVKKESVYRVFLHLFMLAENNDLVYIRSDDYGKTWSTGVTLATDLRSNQGFSFIAGSKYRPSSFYLQYTVDHAMLISWSKNHGASFEQPIKVSNHSSFKSNQLCLCNFEYEPLLVSADVKYNHSDSRMRVAFLRDHQFVDVPYPFGNVRGYRPESLMLDCEHVVDGIYSVNFAIGTEDGRFIYSAEGVLRGA